MLKQLSGIRIVPSCLLVVAFASCRTPVFLEGQWSPPLQNRTAWMLLGYVDVTSGDWVTQLRHKTDESVSPGVPKIGDIIAMTKEVQVYIREFRVTGERRRLEPLVGGRIADDDETGIRLLPGTRIRVADVYLEPVIAGKQGVWVRVVPM